MSLPSLATSNSSRSAKTFRSVGAAVWISGMLVSGSAWAQTPYWNGAQNPYAPPQGVRPAPAYAPQPAQYPAQAYAPASTASTAGTGSDSTLSGTHLFVGALFLGGPTSWTASASYDGYPFPSNTTNGSSLLGLRGGVYLDKLELALELSPKTFWWAGGSQPGSFQMNVTAGYLFPLAETSGFSVYWPLRGGVGFVVDDQSHGAFALRGNLIGVALKFGPIVVDAYVPSFRWAYFPSIGSGGGSTSTSGNLFSVLFGGGASYVF